MKNNIAILGSTGSIGKTTLTIINNNSKKFDVKLLTAKNDIKKGEIFTKKNITTKRPGSGVSPFKINKFLGKKSPKNFKKDQLIK